MEVSMNNILNAGIVMIAASLASHGAWAAQAEMLAARPKAPVAVASEAKPVKGKKTGAHAKGPRKRGKKVSPENKD
jgi:hypothetical protein